MRKRGSLQKTAALCTGKYGILALTALNVCLACLVLALSGNWKPMFATGGNQDFMTFYLVDYRVGFVSRALIGSVLYLFTAHPTVRMVTNLLRVTILCSLLLFAFLQAQLARKALRTSGYAVLLLSYLFYLNNIFWCSAFECFGLLDVFMTVLLQIYLLCAEQKRSLGYILAPIVCALGLTIHTAFFFAGFPVVAAILRFDLLRNGKPDRARLSLFGAACVVSAALFVLFVFFTREMVRIGPDELLALMKQKYDGPIDEDYYLIYLYRISQKRSGLTGDNLLSFLFGESRNEWFSVKMLRHFFNILPLTALFFGGCAYHARHSGNRKIAYLGFAAPFAALFASLAFSTDKERFFSLFLIAQYMLLHCIVTQTDDAFLPCAATAPRKGQSPIDMKAQNKRMDNVLLVCALAGLAHTLLSIYTL